MEIDVVKNARRNVPLGVLNKMVAILCPFVTRTLIQYVLGEEYLGLDSLFRSIISVLSMSELGFSSAIVYCMYRPVAKNDTATVNALLGFYRKAYHIVGVVILGIGLMLMPFLDLLIKGSRPSDVNITLIYLLYLGNAAISYFMYAYLSSLIVVYQREDVNSITNMIVTLLLTICQMVIILNTKNFWLFSLAMPIFTVVNNLRIAFVVHKMYPQYHCVGSLSKDIIADLKQMIAGTLVNKVCQTTRNSIDSICLSAFIGLAYTAIYNNYYSIIAAVNTLLGVFSTSIVGGIGNHIVTKGKEENFSEMKRLDWVYMTISGWCCAFLLCLLQPFMCIWMGEQMLLPFPVVILLCLYFYLLKLGDIKSIYVAGNGLWWNYRYNSVTETILNLVLNILLGKYFGVYGIVLATILTIFFIKFFWGSLIFFSNYYGKNKLSQYFQYHAGYFIINSVICIICYLMCLLINVQGLFMTFGYRFLICVFVPALLYILIYRKTDKFQWMVRKVLHRGRQS